MAVPAEVEADVAPEPAVDDERPASLSEALPDDLEMTPVLEGEGAGGRRGLFGR